MAFDSLDKVLAFPDTGQQIRILGTPDRPLWVVKEVCDILGHGNPTRAVERANVPEDQTELMSAQDLRLTSSQSQMARSLLCVTEGGLYRLIAASRKPIGVRFRAWVFDVVLPAIRRGKLTSQPETLSEWKDEVKACLAPFLARLEEGSRETNQRLQRIESQLDAKTTPRRDFKVSVLAEWGQVLKRHYNRLCPACREVEIVNERGEKLPESRAEHYLGSHDCASPAGWLLCEACADAKTYSSEQTTKQALLTAFSEFQRVREGMSVRQLQLFEDARGA